MSVGVALTGGADYHMSSVVVLLILQLYVVFGFPSLRADLAAGPRLGGAVFTASCRFSKISK